MTTYVPRFSLILVLVISGCGVPQTNPIHTADDIVYEPSLNGTWETKLNAALKITIQVSRWTQDDNSYRLIVTEEHGTSPVGELRAYLSRIDGKEYFTLASADKEPKVNFYNTIVVDQLQPQLRVRLLKREWLFQAIKSGKTMLSHKELPDALLITATTKELRQFFDQHRKEDGPWDKYVLTKTQPDQPTNR
jgi:hypothetical protein